MLQISDSIVNYGKYQNVCIINETIFPAIFGRYDTETILKFTTKIIFPFFLVRILGKYLKWTIFPDKAYLSAWYNSSQPWLMVKTPGIIKTVFFRVNIDLFSNYIYISIFFVELVNYQRIIFVCLKNVINPWSDILSWLSRSLSPLW